MHINKIFYYSRLFLLITYKLIPKKFQLLNQKILSLKKLQNRNSRASLYVFYYKFFLYNLPLKIFFHRLFFKRDNRGFGEDAFHAFWYILFKCYKPKTCLEIGVHNGQVITLWGLLSKEFNYSIFIGALSPFNGARDKVSKYKNINYLKNNLEFHKNFNIPQPVYCKSLSTSKIGKCFINKRKWDLIYIDGNHNYRIVLKDYQNSMKNLSENGIIVFDDSSYYLDCSNFPAMAFKGHPGPSKIVKNIIEKNKLKLIANCGHLNAFIKH
jgi:hypothetical protein